MSFVSLYDANKAYSCIAKYYINIHEVEHREFAGFCLSLKQLEQSIREDKNDELLFKFIKNLKKYRFKICSSPRPFNDSSVINPVDIKNLSVTASKIEVVFPDYAQEARETFSLFSTIVNKRDNPLMDYLIDYSKTVDLENCALLLKEKTNDLHLILSQHPALEYVKVVTCPELRGSEYFKRLLIIGPNYWFPKFVFNSPHAEEIDIFVYSWLKNYWKSEPSFLGAIKNLDNIKISRQVVERDETKIDTSLTQEIHVDGDEFIEEIDWEQVSRNYSKTISENVEHDNDSVMSRFLLLEGDYCVFIEESVSAKVLIIDLDNHEPRIERVSNLKVAPGMFILLRTSGGGDYIFDVADRIMGKDAINMRQVQKQWKSLFRKEVQSRGASKISQVLMELGSEIACEVNVRNWMSERTIKPDNYKDFEAIIRLIGEGEKAKKYWDNARKIFLSHKRAGQVIRRLLLKQVLKSDLSQLHRVGKLEFELENADGGSMTAFRVKFISQENFEVPLSKLGVVNYAGREGKYYG